MSAIVQTRARQGASAAKPDLTQLILAVIAPFPAGLTTAEVCELTGTTSYNASSKLSKMAAYGQLEATRAVGTGRPNRWRIRAEARR